jgi:hypothetical protein
MKRYSKVLKDPLQREGEEAEEVHGILCECIYAEPLKERIPIIPTFSSLMSRELKCPSSYLLLVHPF